MFQRESQSLGNDVIKEAQSLKGHWITSASFSEFFFKKVEIFIPLEV